MTIKRRFGKGYKLGPRKPSPLPDDAAWATASQVCRRYGRRSLMWLWRKLNDPQFPKPRYEGRLRLYEVAALNQYDRDVLKRKTAPPTRNTTAQQRRKTMEEAS
ncbi:hypothetical protein ACRQ5Q_17900 [Bradyrhizobium sp. PMVTL-01]|uniref:hypothetical protein n=1 Tax=Bradyrhizobium sp. PMVTL-01 TaxID=3434999 RepID=UPI003F710D05